jgi:hypothetical protein
MFATLTIGPIVANPVELFVYELPTGSVFLTEIIVTICVNLTLCRNELENVRR